MHIQFDAFPYEPYEIQKDFMAAVYAAIENCAIGIMESPTGTGKTLSVICSALQWLVDMHKLEINDPKGTTSTDIQEAAVTEDEPDWMRDYVPSEINSNPSKLTTREMRCKERERKRLERKVKELEGKTLMLRSSFLKIGEKPSRAKKTVRISEDDEFVLEDWNSDEESAGSKRANKINDSSSEDDEVKEKEFIIEEPLKVYYCSRTHSQLTQFIGELKRTTFASSLVVSTLASRKSLCINDDVLRLQSSSMINERCMDLQNSKSSKSKKLSDSKKSKSRSCGCPFKGNFDLEQKFSDEVVLSGPMDIEDLVETGKRLGTCPYYGSRNVMSEADVVVLPYQTLLHSSTRESLKLPLKNCVIIIDEAHNLVDTISSMYSSQVSQQQITSVQVQLKDYLTRFKTRLAPPNRRYIQQLLVIADSLLTFLKNFKSGVENKVWNLSEFEFESGIDNQNLVKLVNYLKKSNIVHKVSSYGLALSEKTGNENTEKGNVFSSGKASSVTSFRAFADFLTLVTSADEDGRIFVSTQETQTTPELTDGKDSPKNPEKPTNIKEEKNGKVIKFVMLNAAKHFRQVLREARAVILAGGTLQPIEEIKDRLLPELEEKKIQVFSCGHIVPKEQVLTIAMSRGPTGKTFDFKFQNRGSKEMIEELGRFLVNLSSVVPEGIVCFFPSFAYEAQVMATWEISTVLSSIQKKKKVFREPRSAVEVESILEEYKRCIVGEEGLDGQRKNGAILFCVVGGRMSEGINFSDGMGRCVVMVGLPFPSPSDPELLERMKYLDKSSGRNLNEQRVDCNEDTFDSAVTLKSCGAKGREYYENLCMKAVNQSIGRAIRHKGDYAAILLVDHRYGSVSGGPFRKLPGWISESFQTQSGGFGEVIRTLHKFFKANSKRS